MEFPKNCIKTLFPNLYFRHHMQKYERQFAQIGDPIEYAKRRYKQRFGTELHLENPISFYDKLCYLKFCYDEPNPEQLIDKVLVKEYLDALGLGEYCAKKIASFSDFDSFKRFFDEGANGHDEFVVKLNHTSGDVFFYNHGKWRNKTGQHVGRRFVFAALRNMLGFNYYHMSLERIYEHVHPQILVEEYLPSIGSKGLDEYKFFCNHGVVKLINVVHGRQNSGRIKEAFTDADLHKLPVNQGHDELAQEEIYRPLCFEKMLDFCAKTVANRIQVRVDLMTDGTSFRFCEFTFYDCGGFNIFQPIEQNEAMGQLLDIREALHQ